MSDVFDPLSFFDPVSIEDELTEKTEASLDKQTLNETVLISVEKEEKEKEKEKKEEGELQAVVADPEEIEEIPATVLDLPLPFAPFDILLSTLKLLQPAKTTNFSRDTDNLVCLDDIGLQPENIKQISNYLSLPETTILTFTALPVTASTDLTAYFTRIIAHPLSHLSEEERDLIYDLASYIMSANSAPALRGNSTRYIKLDNSIEKIALYEPALTEDKVGNITWGASLVLSNAIVSNSSITSSWLDYNDSSPILELGAGTGLVSIILANQNTKHHIISTDLPEIIDNLAQNIKLNNIECNLLSSEEKFTISQKTDEITVTYLDWTNPSEFLERSYSTETKFEILIFSDPVYSHQHPFWVRDTVKALLSSKKGSKVVFMVGRRERFEDVRDSLWNLISGLGLILSEADTIDSFDDYGQLIYDYKIYSR